MKKKIFWTKASLVLSAVLVSFAALFRSPSLVKGLPSESKDYLFLVFCIAGVLFALIALTLFIWQGLSKKTSKVHHTVWKKRENRWMEDIHEEFT